MLVLVGVQGSGKSTFSQKLIEGAAAGSCKWVRVNQDSVNNGRRGTREMCLAAAQSALTSGRSAIIDRTNIDASQRKPFLTLARESLAQARRVMGGASSTLTLGPGSMIFVGACLAAVQGPSRMHVTPCLTCTG